MLKTCSQSLLHSFFPMRPDDQEAKGQLLPMSFLHAPGPGLSEPSSCYKKIITEFHLATGFLCDHSLKTHGKGHKGIMIYKAGFGLSPVSENNICGSLRSPSNNRGDRVF